MILNSYTIVYQILCIDDGMGLQYFKGFIELPVSLPLEEIEKVDHTLQDNFFG